MTDSIFFYVSIYLSHGSDTLPVFSRTNTLYSKRIVRGATDTLFFETNIQKRMNFKMQRQARRQQLQWRLVNGTPSVWTVKEKRADACWVETATTACWVRASVLFYTVDYIIYRVKFEYTYEYG